MLPVNARSSILEGHNDIALFCHLSNTMFTQVTVPKFSSKTPVNPAIPFRNYQDKEPLVGCSILESLFVLLYTL